jgi:NADH-quinone oxidoreductase subunit H
VGSWVLAWRSSRKEAELERQAAREAAKPFNAFAGGYPVPPMPGQDFAYTSRVSRRGLAGATVTVASPADSDVDDDSNAAVGEEKPDA